MRRQIGQFIFEVIGYFTAKVALPIVTLGKARAEAIAADEGPFRWHGFKRVASGIIVVQRSAACLIGLLFWVIGGIAGVVLWI